MEAIYGFISSWFPTLSSSLSQSSSPSSPNPSPHQQQQQRHLSSSRSSPFRRNPNPNPNPDQHQQQRHLSSSRSSPLRRNPNPNPPLTEQQQQILDAVASGRSVFITGSAGTGKTLLLSVVIRRLRQLHPPSTVFVTASTGVAACALSGQTLHSFAGVGLGNGDLPSLIRKVSANKLAAARWASAAALVIDEISMIDGQLFDRLDSIARAMRPWAAGLPWGGIQLIVSGDFFQLPPISAPNPLNEFAFEAKCWASSFHSQIELTHIFRQSDSVLIDILQGIRQGRKDENLRYVLEQYCSDSPSNDDDKTTRLFPRNEDVRKLNAERMKSLGREIVTYVAIDKGEDPWIGQLKQGIAPKEVELCEGARVMLIKNTDVGIGLVNGATGTVTGFVDDENGKVRKMCGGGVLPRVQFDAGPELVVNPERWDVMEGEAVRAQRKQIPLILAWALSVHKCQGMTLDRLHTDLSRAFGCGMVYVALSRVRTLAGLRLSGFNPYKIKAHPKVLRFYAKLLSTKP